LLRDYDIRKDESKTFSWCSRSELFASTQGCRPGQSDETTAHAILDKFLELGGNFIDTANVYSSGESENIIGEESNCGVRENIIGEESNCGVRPLSQENLRTS